MRRWIQIIISSATGDATPSAAQAPAGSMADIWPASGIAVVATVLLALTLSGCGESPVAPSAGQRLQLPLGRYTFMASATAKDACSATGSAAPSFMFFTGVTLGRDGQEWVARSSAAADGDLELRFHETEGGTMLSMAVSGTIRGTAASANNATLNIKQYISFSGTGGIPTAQLSGTTGAPSSPTIVFGPVTGVIRVTDSIGGVAACPTLTEWSIQPRTDL